MLSERAKEVILKLAPLGIWVALICFGLTAVDQDDTGLLSLYLGMASIASACIMFLVWKD
jgi:hypothetical protein